MNSRSPLLSFLFCLWWKEISQERREGCLSDHCPKENAATRQLWMWESDNYTSNTTPSEEVNPTLHYHRNTVGFLLPFSHLPFANPLLSAGWLQHAWKSSSKLFQAWAFPAPLLSFLSVFPSLGSCEDVRKVEDKTISSEISHSSLQFRGWCSGAVNTP